MNARRSVDVNVEAAVLSDMFVDLASFSCFFDGVGGEGAQVSQAAAGVLSLCDNSEFFILICFLQANGKVIFKEWCLARSECLLVPVDF